MNQLKTPLSINPIHPAASVQTRRMAFNNCLSSLLVRVLRYLRSFIGPCFGVCWQVKLLNFFQIRENPHFPVNSSLKRFHENGPVLILPFNSCKTLLFYITLKGIRLPFSFLFFLHGNNAPAHPEGWEANVPVHCLIRCKAVEEQCNSAQRPLRPGSVNCPGQTPPLPDRPVPPRSWLPGWLHARYRFLYQLTDRANKSFATRTVSSC